MRTPRWVHVQGVRVVFVVLSLLWLAQTAAASDVGGVGGDLSWSSAVLRASSVSRGVGDFVTADGRLQAPIDYEGSLDLAGWQGWIDEAGSLRFAPDDTWRTTGTPSVATANTFSALGSGTVGTNHSVTDLVALGGDLYLGGQFAQAGGMTVNNVARYNPTTNTFSALGSGTVGTNGSVFGLVALGGDLYLGGYFTKAGGVTVNNVARYTVTEPVKPAVWRSGTWFLRNTLNGGPADSIFLYGASTDTPLMCDWDGNGSKTVGVFRNGAWFLRNSNTTGISDLAIGFGSAGDTPICGDWDGDSVETVGVVRGNAWYLRNSNTNGIADVVFLYGAAGDLPVVGDWDGNGTDTPGLLRGGTWFLRNSNDNGGADLVFLYGLAGDKPIAGDWDTDGIDTVGVVRGNLWYLRNSNTSGMADIVFQFGAAGDTPLVWR